MVFIPSNIGVQTQPTDTEALRVKGTVVVDDPTNATSTTTGAFVVLGGVGILKDLYVGGTVNFESFVASRVKVKDILTFSKDSAGNVLEVKADTDSSAKLSIDNLGKIGFGAGGATVADVYLQRISAGILQTLGSMNISQNLTVAGTTQTGVLTSGNIGSSGVVVINSPNGSDYNLELSALGRAGRTRLTHISDNQYKIASSIGSTDYSELIVQGSNKYFSTLQFPDNNGSQGADIYQFPSTLNQVSKITTDLAKQTLKNKTLQELKISTKSTNLTIGSNVVDSSGASLVSMGLAAASSTLDGLSDSSIEASTSKTVILINNTNMAINVLHKSTAALPSQRLSLPDGNPLLLQPGSSITFNYDNSSNLWIMAATSATSVNPDNQSIVKDTKDVISVKCSPGNGVIFDSTGVQVDKEVVATLNDQQTITKKKIILGPTADESNKLELSYETSFNLLAMSRKQGSLYYCNNLNGVVYDDGTFLYLLKGTIISNWNTIVIDVPITVIYQIFVDDNGTTYACTDLGLYASKDFKTFTKVLDGIVAGESASAVFSMVSVGIFVFAVAGTSLYKSSDYGATFTKVAGLIDVNSVMYWQGNVYVGKTTGGMYSSGDDGATFNAIATTSAINSIDSIWMSEAGYTVVHDSSSTGSQGFYLAPASPEGTYTQVSSASVGGTNNAPRISYKACVSDNGQKVYIANSSGLWIYTVATNTWKNITTGNGLISNNSSTVFNNNGLTIVGSDLGISYSLDDNVFTGLQPIAQQPITAVFAINSGTKLAGGGNRISASATVTNDYSIDVTRLLIAGANSKVARTSRGDSFSYSDLSKWAGTNGVGILTVYQCKFGTVLAGCDGTAVANGYGLIVSTDGGSTWQPNTNTGSFKLPCVHANDTATTVVCGGFETGYHYTRSGALDKLQWVAYTSPTATGSPSIDIKIGTDGKVYHLLGNNKLYFHNLGDTTATLLDSNVYGKMRAGKNTIMYQALAPDTTAPPVLKIYNVITGSYPLNKSIGTMTGLTPCGLGSTDDGQTIYYAAKKNDGTTIVYRSVDGGVSFFITNNGNPLVDEAISCVVDDFGKPFLATRNNSLYYSDDVGATYKTSTVFTSTTTLTWSAVKKRVSSSVVVDDGWVYYAGIDGYLYISKDKAKTFTKMEICASTSSKQFKVFVDILGNVYCVVFDTGEIWKSNDVRVSGFTKWNTFTTAASELPAKDVAGIFVDAAGRWAVPFVPQNVGGGNTLITVYDGSVVNKMTLAMYATGVYMWKGIVIASGNTFSGSGFGTPVASSVGYVNLSSPNTVIYETGFATVKSGVMRSPRVYGEGMLAVVSSNDGGHYYARNDDLTKNLGTGKWTTSGVTGSTSFFGLTFDYLGANGAICGAYFSPTTGIKVNVYLSSTTPPAENWVFELTSDSVDIQAIQLSTDGNYYVHSNNSTKNFYVYDSKWNQLTKNTSLPGSQNMQVGWNIVPNPNKPVQQTPIVVGGSDGRIFMSIDNGATYNTNTVGVSGETITGIYITADGKIVACSDKAYVYVGDLYNFNSPFTKSAGNSTVTGYTSVFVRKDGKIVCGSTTGAASAAYITWFTSITNINSPTNVSVNSTTNTYSTYVACDCLNSTAVTVISSTPFCSLLILDGSFGNPKTVSSTGSVSPVTAPFFGADKNIYFGYAGAVQTCSYSAVIYNTTLEANVSGIFCDRSGVVWAITTKGNLWSSTNKGQSFAKVGNNITSAALNGISIDANGIITVTDNTGKVYRSVNGGQSFISAGSAAGSSSVFVGPSYLPYNTVVAGTLYVRPSYPNETSLYYSNDNAISFSKSYISNIASDYAIYKERSVFALKDGTVWTCDNAGYVYWANNPITSTTWNSKRVGSDSNYLTSIFVDANGTVWTCSSNGYVYWANNPTTSTTWNSKQVSRYSLYSIFVDVNGTVWTCDNAGFVYWGSSSQASGTWGGKRVTISNYIISIFVDVNGTVWTCDNVGYVYWANSSQASGTWNSKQVSRGSYLLSSIFVDVNGTVWTCSGNGYVYHSDDNGQTWTSKDVINTPLNSITSSASILPYPSDTKNSVYINGYQVGTQNLARSWMAGTVFSSIQLATAQQQMLSGRTVFVGSDSTVYALTVDASGNATLNISQDNGCSVTTKSIGNMVTNQNPYVLYVDSSNNIFVGAQNYDSIKYSTNGGTSWNTATIGNNITSVTDIFLDAYGTVYVAGIGSSSSFVLSAPFSSTIGAFTASNSFSGTITSVFVNEDASKIYAIVSSGQTLSIYWNSSVGGNWSSYALSSSASVVSRMFADSSGVYVVGNENAGTSSNVYWNTGSDLTQGWSSYNISGENARGIGKDASGSVYVLTTSHLRKTAKISDSDSWKTYSIGGIDTAMSMFIGGGALPYAKKIRPAMLLAGGTVQINVNLNLPAVYYSKDNGSSWNMFQVTADQGSNGRTVTGIARNKTTGMYYLCCADGKVYLSSDGVSVLGMGMTISSYLTSIFVDVNGTVWTCDNAGYVYWANNPITSTTWNSKQVSSDSYLTSIFVDVNGTVWTCGYNGYVYWAKNPTTSTTWNSKQVSSDSYSLYCIVNL